MVDIIHIFEGNLHKIMVSITSLVAKNAEEEWIVGGDLIIQCPSPLGATLIYDFNFSVSSIIEITMDGSTWAPINENVALVGRQSRYLRVLNGDKVNFRAKLAGNLNRLVIGEV